MSATSDIIKSLGLDVRSLSKLPPVEPETEPAVTPRAPAQLPRPLSAEETIFRFLQEAQHTLTGSFLTTNEMRHAPEEVFVASDMLKRTEQMLRQLLGPIPVGQNPPEREDAEGEYFTFAPGDEKPEVRTWMRGVVAVFKAKDDFNRRIYAWGWFSHYDDFHHYEPGVTHYYARPTTLPSQD